MRFRAMSVRSFFCVRDLRAPIPPVLSMALEVRTLRERYPRNPYSSDDLEVLEVGDDLGEALAVVLDDLAGLAGGGLVDGHDLLAGAGGAHGAGIDAEVGQRELVDRLRLGGHDALEARVAGLDHAGGHRHE